MYNLSTLNQSLAGSIYADKLHYLPVTGSTNSDARDAARTHAPHGSVYLADEQTAGRGRSDHKWESAAGEGLYVSVLLRPNLDPQMLQWLPLAAGLAAAEAIKTVADLVVDLRWPNDLLIGASKVGGILVEAKLASDAAGAQVDSVVVGIGVNVHQRSFTEGVEATSLDLERERKAAAQIPNNGVTPDGGNTDVLSTRGTVPPINRQTLLICLLQQMQRETDALLTEEGRNRVRTRLEQSSTWLVQRAVAVHGPQACVGVTMGMDPAGMLLVQTENEMVTVRTGGIRDVAR